jgi:hypothetical protein
MFAVTPVVHVVLPFSEVTAAAAIAVVKLLRARGCPTIELGDVAGIWIAIITVVVPRVTLVVLKNSTKQAEEFGLYRYQPYKFPELDLTVVAEVRAATNFKLVEAPAADEGSATPFTVSTPVGAVPNAESAAVSEFVPSAIDEKSGFVFESAAPAVCVILMGAG